MAKNTFDDLLQALQASMITAQEALQARYEAAIRKIHEIDNTGAARSSVLTFVTPWKHGDNEAFENFSLSVLSFLGQQQPRISMLSLDFNFSLKRKDLAGGSWNYYLLIKKSRRWQLGRKDLHRMTIVFNGTDKMTGEVGIDSRFFLNIPDQEAQCIVRSTTIEDISFLKKLLNRINELWQPQGFVMTVEQSEKVRALLESRNNEDKAREEAAA